MVLYPVIRTLRAVIAPVILLSIGLTLHIVIGKMVSLHIIVVCKTLATVLVHTTWLMKLSVYVVCRHALASMIAIYCADAMPHSMFNFIYPRAGKIGMAAIPVPLVYNVYAGSNSTVISTAIKTTVKS